ncbi:hypothetical protein O3P69_018177 [Scylla paramamosain]|uniref:Uncharacterized protein n=1 Tax=Scylla paramamosain TaxID=85552 RepID=A0AAW0TJ45_SCYPA
MTPFLVRKRQEKIFETRNDDANLGLLMVTVVRQELSHCDLVLACSATFCRSSVLHTLLMFPNLRQVVKVTSAEDLVAIDWIPNRCGGYIMLLEHLEPLLALAMLHHHSWNYAGRYVVVAGSVTQLEALVTTRNGKKTENILGVVKIASDTWRLYTNQLYWSPGVKTIATYSRSGFHVQQPNLFPEKVGNLRGAALKVSTFNFEPSIIYYRAENGSLLFRFGEEISLIKAIARSLNFTPEFAEPADGETWGWMADNGSWTGTHGELQRDEVDIVISNLYVSYIRAKIFDFTVPFQDEMVCFLARTELPLPRWQALAFPFQNWTWLAIFCGIIASGPALWLVANVSNVCGEEVPSFRWLGFSWYYAFGLHFCESQQFLPRMLSTRIFVAFLWMYCIILTIVYSGNLTAFLLVRRPPASIQTIEDLYNSGLEVAALADIIFMSSIKYSNDPYLRGLSKVFRVYANEYEVFPIVLAGKAVFLESRSFGEFHIATQFSHGSESSMRFMKECFAPYPIAMALQKHSPLKRKFDIVIGWVVQSGLLYHYFQESVRLTATMKGRSNLGQDYGGVVMTDRSVVALNLDHLQGLFIISCIVLIPSFLVFALEKLHFAFNQG